MPPRPLDTTLTHALGVAMTHRSVRNLQSTALGAFIGLALAALEEGIDPFSITGVTCQRYARATPRQWQAIGKEVLGALQEALPSVVLEYRKRLQGRQSRLKAGQNNLAEYNAKKKLAAKDRAGATFSLSDQNVAPTILHPVKAPAYRPTNTDMQLRQVAKNAPKSSGFVLTDKN